VADLNGRIHGALRSLSPGYFAMVMTTGVVSVGLRTEGYDTLSDILLGLAVAGFAVLVVLNGWRFVSHRHELAWDFTHPLRGFGFYTFVAAGNVLADRLAQSHTGVALTLLTVTTICWITRGYALPWTTRLGAGEHPIVAAANGTWFMWAVGAQSIAVAAASLERVRPNLPLAQLALMAWTIGLFLYVLDGVFVAMRLLAYDFSAADLTPPYWISMGAAAITALAGTAIAHLPPDPYVDAARELVRGGALLAWTVASWLVPALVAMGWWRHVTRGVPFRYSAELWSITFPIGMYAVATQTIARDDRLPGLDDLGSVAQWVAFAVWLIVSAMAVEHVVRDVLLDRPVRLSRAGS